MSVREYGSRSTRWRLGGSQWGPFIGGINIRDDPMELDPTELSDSSNFTLDERGKAVKRNDCPTASSADWPTPPGAVVSAFYSQLFGQAFMHQSTTLYKNVVGTWTAITGTVKSSIMQFGEINGKLVFAQNNSSNDNNIWTYDGTTLTNVKTLTAPIAGSLNTTDISLAIWQNKVWAGVGNRLFWSNAGDPATWTTASDFVDIRDKDNKKITALFPTAGALLVFKEDSSYRINDSTTGAYTTIDEQAGCVGPFSITAQDGAVVMWGLDGLYRGNGVGRFVNVGDKLRPRFLSGLNGGNAVVVPKMGAISLNGRMYFSYSKASSTIPESILEYNPRVGWIMEHFINARVGPFAKYLNGATGNITGIFASASATFKEMFTGTTRNGYSASMTTGYQEPFGGVQARMLRYSPEIYLGAGGGGPIRNQIRYRVYGGSTNNLYQNDYTFSTDVNAQRGKMQPQLQGEAFQITVTDGNQPVNQLEVIKIGADYILSALR